MTQTLENWAENRGLDIELLSRLGVQELSDGTSFKLPFVKDGVEVNAKVRSLHDKTMRFEKTKDVAGELPAFNFDCLNDNTLIAEPLIITEGEIDTISAIQAGFLRVISVPNGAPNQASDDPEYDTERYKWVDDVIQKLKRDETIIIAADNDTPGANLLHDLSIILGRSRCKWLNYPKDCKDFNDALSKYGVAGVQKSVQTAKWMEVDGIYKLSDLPPAPPLEPLNLNWQLDKNMKLAKGQFSVLTGTPNAGKSTFVNDICGRLNQIHGWKIAFASFEQDPMQSHIPNLCRWFHEKPYNQQSPNEIAEAHKWINDNFLFIKPSMEDDITLDWMLDRLAAVTTRHNVDMVVIDPWNEMDHARHNGESLTEYTGRAIKKFKQFAATYNIHLMVAAHPTKLQPSSKGKIGVPTLYDISDSAHWNNKADIGIVIHRDDEEGVSIHVKKVRNQELCGEPGVAWVEFFQTTGRYQFV